MKQGQRRSTTIRPAREMTEAELDAITPEEMKAMCESMLVHAAQTADQALAAAERRHAEHIAHQQAREQARVRAGLPP